MSDLHEKLGCTIRTTSLNLQLIDLIGVGTFAAVYIASDTGSGTPYAVKALFKKGLTPSQQQLQRKEIALHATLSHHRNVCTLHAITEDDQCLYLILEYCHDDLYNLIQHTPLSDTQVTRLYLDILYGVREAHDHGIFHRDLKPENVLVDKNLECAKLADFGLATKERFCRDLGCGTVGYLSPESLDPTLSGYDPRASDIWALGMILINLRFRCKLWESADPTTHDIFYTDFTKNPRRYFSRMFPKFSSSLINLLMRIFERDPKKRIRLRELIKVFEAGIFRFEKDERFDEAVYMESYAEEQVQKMTQASTTAPSPGSPIPSLPRQKSDTPTPPDSGFGTSPRLNDHLSNTLSTPVHVNVLQEKIEAIQLNKIEAYQLEVRLNAEGIDDEFFP